MIDLYTFQTSNGQRAAIMLEECGFPYRVHKVDLFKNEQQAPDYLALNPIGAIPVIVDPAGPGGKPLTLTQSGAIALYLAEKAGRFMPTDPLRRVAALQWLMYAMTDCAPASANLFLLGVRAPEKSEPNLEWLGERMLRYFRVADAPARRPRIPRRRAVGRRFRPLSRLRGPQGEDRRRWRHAQSGALGRGTGRPPGYREGDGRRGLGPHTATALSATSRAAGDSRRTRRATRGGSGLPPAAGRDRRRAVR